MNENIKYELTSSILCIDEEIFITYGIRAIDGTAVNDISPNRTFVAALVERIIALDLAPCQLFDVVEDVLC